MPKMVKKKWLSILSRNNIILLAAVATIVGVVWTVATSPQIEHEYNSFPVHVSANSEYNLEPFYLRDNDRFHFTWSVQEGGEVTVGLVMPTGEFFGFCEKSDTLEKDQCKPLKRSSVAFKPLEYGWGTGYYIVTIAAHSKTAKLKV